MRKTRMIKRRTGKKKNQIRLEKMLQPLLLEPGDQSEGAEKAGQTRQCVCDEVLESPLPRACHE